MQAHFVDLLTSTLLTAHFLPPETFADWLWMPGMGFQEKSLWWGARKQRIVLHEGVDFACYRDRAGKIKNLIPGLFIPTLFSGRIVQLHRDFLAWSLYIRHDQFRKSGAVLHTVFGHVQPVRDDCVGQELMAGETVAVLNRYLRNDSVPLHFHFTAAWISDQVDPEQLDWQLLGDRSRVILVNPWSSCPLS